MRLLFIRHGEPQASLDRVVGGPKGCRGLTDLGRLQVEALRDRLLASNEIEAQATYTSILARAVETASILEPAIGWAVEDCDLCELHPGECDGSSWDDHASAFPTWDAPDKVFSPGGESLASFDRRVRRALVRLTQPEDDRTVVVVGHGGFIEAASLAFMEGPKYSERRPYVTALHFTSITEWQRLPDGRWRLERYNDAGHLRGLPLVTPGGVLPLKP